MSWTTADLSDAHPDAPTIGTHELRWFGRVSRFSGPIRTVRVHEDNTLVRSELETPGNAAVMVVDGGGSTNRALVGDRLAQLAIDNGWAGIVVWGAIRDAEAIDRMSIGVLARATCPRRSKKRGEGAVGGQVRFAGATFSPGEWIYADRDGLLMAPARLDS